MEVAARAAASQTSGLQKQTKPVRRATTEPDDNRPTTCQLRLCLDSVLLSWANCSRQGDNHASACQPSSPALQTRHGPRRSTLDGGHADGPMLAPFGQTLGAQVGLQTKNSAALSGPPVLPIFCSKQLGQSPRCTPVIRLGAVLQHPLVPFRDPGTHRDFVDFVDFMALGMNMPAAWTGPHEDK